ncbi:M20/M25/M40 family metallo-hydrolase [Halorarius litoreus]|uniref:M20/M25/M40 family metallo-hydrolase n=1 Tax=Halorarius litoreus TaxID=2962676 RepID=UPI0020CC8BE4|nr:M20/M25/M40 family metallo-hydrolase [Halorarius litoreus]
MDDDRRAFLDDLLATATPSGFETAGQRVWLDYVETFADEVRTDDYGNAIAVYEGDGDLDVLLGGHGDEIGLMVRDVTDDGHLKLTRVGGADRTVTRGQYVTVHGRDGPVPGVVGQVAIHLRDPADDDHSDITEMHVDIGAADEEEARDLVEVGDPITFDTEVQDLAGSLVAARGMDNRTGIWAAAEGLRRAAERDASATVYAVSTVQEEVGRQGAKMVGFDLHPDVALATDVTHATDTPEAPSTKGSSVELGSGPVVGRGSSNHPVVVEAVRAVARGEDIGVQLSADGITTGTDADVFYTSRSGVPTLNISLPNRYMHTPVEVIDTDDLDEVAELMGAFAARADEFAPFHVEV